MKTPDSRLCVTQDFMLRFEYLDQVTSLKSPAFLKAAILFLEASYYALLKYTFLSLSLSLSLVLSAYDCHFTYYVNDARIKHKKRVAPKVNGTLKKVRVPKIILYQKIKIWFQYKTE